MELELYVFPMMTTLPAVVKLFSFYPSSLLKDPDEYHMYITSIIPIFCLHSFISKFYSNLLGQSLPLLLIRALSRFTQWIEFLGRSISQASVTIYMDTVAALLMSYMSLLVINLSFIWLIAFPSITLAFIAAVSNKQLRDDHRAGDGEVTPSPSRGDTIVDEGGDRRSKDRRRELAAMVVVPCWILCATGHYVGGTDSGSFAVSQFLLYLGSSLGELALMTARLARLTEAVPGLAPASELLRRATLVVLLVTAHAVAAELLGGEDAVGLICLQELAPALLWFSFHLDRGSSAVTISGIKRHGNVLSVLAAAAVAVVAYLAATMDERGLSVCSMASVSCGVSGLLVYCVVLVLHEWPKEAETATSSLKEVVQLLKFWGNTLLAVAATLMVLASLTAFRLGLHEQLFATVAKCFRDYIDRFPKLIV